MTLRVPLPDGADAGDGVQVYTDFGGGTIDAATPLLPGPAPLFPRHVGRVERSDSYLHGVHGWGRFASRPAHRAGHGSQIHGVSEYPPATPFVAVDVAIPPAFGTHLFEVRMVDEAGNEQATAPVTISAMVSATAPPTIQSSAFAAYDAGGDAVTLSVTKNTE
jgi:hypothetical protein